MSAIDLNSLPPHIPMKQIELTDEELESLRGIVAQRIQKQAARLGAMYHNCHQGPELQAMRKEIRVLDVIEKKLKS